MMLWEPCSHLLQGAHGAVHAHLVDLTSGGMFVLTVTFVLGWLCGHEWARR